MGLGRFFLAILMTSAFGFLVTGCGYITGGIRSFDKASSLPPAPTLGSLSTYYVLNGSNVSVDVIAPATCGVPGCTLSIASTQNGNIGSVTASGHSVVYTPTAGSYGSDSFNYDVSDGLGNKVTGTVQVVVVSAYTWTGQGADANWTTTGNWCGAVNGTNTGCTNTGSAPSSSTDSTQVVVFDQVCTSNCSPTINAAATFYGLQMNSGYTGTLTQATSKTITIGVGGFTQKSGSFVGSNANITDNGELNITGGSFKSTSGTFELNDSNLTIANAATFTANSGTFLHMGPGSTISTTIDAGSAQFNNFEFEEPSLTSVEYLTITGSLSVVNLTLSSGNGFLDYINSGTILISGNVTESDSYSRGYYGSAIIKLIGNTSGQTISDPSAGSLPGVTIAAGSDPVTLSGLICIAGNFTMQSVGTFTAVGSTLCFSNGISDSTQIIIPGTVTYDTVKFYGVAETFDLNGGTLSAHNVILSDSAGTWGGSSPQINNGTLSITGDLTSSEYGYGGSAQIEMTGSSAATITQSSTALFPSGNFTINKSSATVTLTSAATLNDSGQSFDLEAGALDMAGYALTLNSLSLNGTTLTKGGGTLKVGGTTEGTGSLFGGTVDP